MIENNNLDTVQGEVKWQAFKKPLFEEGQAGVKFEPIESSKKEDDSFVFQVREKMMSHGSIVDSMIKF